MNTELLTQIFSIPSSSGDEGKMREFIKNYLDSFSIPYLEDSIGNIYRIDLPDKPLLNAHMDTVQDEIDENLQGFAKIRGNILSGYGVIGADDKCGIYIILDLIPHFEFNFVFTVQEEIGAIGASFFEANQKFDHLPYGLTLDRTNADNIICYKNDYGTQEFENALVEYGKNFGYKPEAGLFSDADHLNEQISIANLSVGYYGHHTKNEYVKLDELQNARNYVQHLIGNLEQNFDAPDKIDTRFMFHHSLLDEDAYFFDFDEGAEEKCFVTGKKSKRVAYLPSIQKYISKEGAYILLAEMDENGLLNQEYGEDSFDSVEDITYKQEELDEDFYTQLEKELMYEYS